MAPAGVVLLVLIALAAPACRAHAVTCTHSTDQSKLVPRVRLEPARLERRETAQPIRFEVYYDESLQSLSQSLRTSIQDDIVPKLLDFLQTTLSVKPSSIVEKILLERSCTTGFAYIHPVTGRRQCQVECAEMTMCDTVIVPNDHLLQCIECGGSSDTCAPNNSTQDGPGVEGKDFILYVSAKAATPCFDSEDSSTTLAFAGPCQMEGTLDRPIAGFVNFCPVAISSNSDEDFLLSVTKHEILHAIAFSSALFPFWRNPDGTPRTNRTNGLPPQNMATGFYEWGETTIRKKVLDWETRNGVVSHTVDIMVTENVVEEGKRQFGCSTLEGVQLEDQGGDGTELSHWEKRVLGNEAMTGIFTTNAGFSRITLAALEDSGWYDVTYDLAVVLPWGKDAGCGLVEGSCREFINSQNASVGADRLNPFCNRLRSANLKRCTVDRAAVALCNLQDVEDASGYTEEYQYFDDATLGGRLGLADFCPFRDAFQLNGRGTECADPDNLPSRNDFAETYSSESRCVLHGQEWRVVFPGIQPFIPRPYGSGCYEYACSNSRVIIYIFGQPYNCSCEGEELTFVLVRGGTRYEGSIICPSCEDICYDQSDMCPSPAPPACYGMVTDVGTSTDAAPHHLMLITTLTLALIVAVLLASTV